MKIEFKTEDGTIVNIEEFSNDPDVIDCLHISFRRWNEETLEDDKFMIVLSTRKEIWDFCKSLKYIAKVV